MAGSKLSAPKEMRARWYLQVEKYGKSVPDVCKIFGVSRKTYYKWYVRDHPEIGGLGKLPRKTHPQTKIFGNLQVAIVEAKKKYNYGPKKMKIYLQREYEVGISASALYKFFKKKNLIRKPQRQQKWYLPLKEPYYATFPGENVQLDVKYVPGENTTWHYQYRFIDTVTNMQFALTLETRSANATILAFKLAKKYFTFPISGIQTDNGGEFRGKFHEYLIRQNIPQRYIPKRSAPWNGKVERANRSVDDEFYLNPERPWKTIVQYNDWYNYERPHLGKGMNGLTPHQKLLTFIKKCHP
jgi:transposase